MSTGVIFCPRCGHELVREETAGRPRPVCPECNYIVYQNPVPGVGILCEMNGGLLMVRRGHPPYEGYWTLPSGYIEADESSEQAAVRECREETGLDIELIELFGVDSFPEGSLSSGIVIFYRARPVGGRLQAGDDAAAVHVFALAEIPHIPFRTHRDVVSRWLAFKKAGPKASRPGVVIRQARLEDEGQILALLKIVPGNQNLNADELATAQRRFREKLGFDVLVAQADGKVVGYLVLSFIPGLSGLRAWIDDVAVDPDYQRRGLGASLVGAAIQTASMRGASHLFVYTRRGDRDVREFYRACGFDEDGVAPLHIR